MVHSSVLLYSLVPRNISVIYSSVPEPRNIVSIDKHSPVQDECASGNRCLYRFRTSVLNPFSPRIAQFAFHFEFFFNPPPLPLPPLPTPTAAAAAIIPITNPDLRHRSVTPTPSARLDACHLTDATRPHTRSASARHPMPPPPLSGRPARPPMPRPPAPECHWPCHPPPPHSWTPPTPSILGYFRQF
jgi:hypothetical protein